MNTGENNNSTESTGATHEASVFAPPYTEPEVPTIVLIIKAVLALVSIGIAILLTSFLFVKIDFEFYDFAKPIPAKTSPRLVQSDQLSETDADGEQISHVNLPLYDFTQTVPESEAVPRSYFDDTVFIGDSRTEGLLLYTNLSPYDFSAAGLNIKSILTKAYIRLPNAQGVNESYTLLDALVREKDNFKSIYISMGLNELGWPVDSFMLSFKNMINAIREVADVPIYIQLVMPLTTEASETTKYGITNEKAVLFNEEFIKLAAEMELFLLDPRGLFALEDGTLDPEVTYDGIHLNPKRYEVVADYYCTHTIDTEAYANLIKGVPSESDEMTDVEAETENTEAPSADADKDSTDTQEPTV